MSVAARTAAVSAAWAEQCAVLEEGASWPTLGTPLGFELAGRSLVLGCASEAAAAWFTAPLRHLVCAPSEQAALELRLAHGWPTRLAGSWPHDSDRAARPRVAIGDGQRIVGGLWPHTGVAGLLDRERRRGLLWVRDLESVPPADAATLFRALAAWWLPAPEYAIVHAAAVAGPGGAALLVGGSGVGKSTTAVACARKGLAILGDDSVLCRADPAEVFSLSCYAHLQEADLAGTPGHAAGIGEKRYVDLETVAPGRVATCRALRAIVRLRIDRGAGTALRPIAKGEALAGLAPSSLLNVPGLDRRAFACMGALARALTAWELVLDGDPGKAAAALAALLGAAA